MLDRLARVPPEGSRVQLPQSMSLFLKAAASHLAKLRDSDQLGCSEEVDGF